nr:hypothetical protein BaRGS_011154 [Batillaria attramentaria]
MYRDRQMYQSMTNAKNKKNKRHKAPQYPVPVFGMPMMPMMMPMDGNKYQCVFVNVCVHASAKYSVIMVIC